LDVLATVQPLSYAIPLTCAGLALREATLAERNLSGFALEISVTEGIDFVSLFLNVLSMRRQACTA